MKGFSILNDVLSVEIHCISSSDMLESDDLHSSCSCGESIPLVNTFKSCVVTSK